MKKYPQAQLVLCFPLNSPANTKSRLSKVIFVLRIHYSIGKQKNLLKLITAMQVFNDFVVI